MEIVIVGGPHSGVGKTLASEVALRALAGRNFGAVKLTVADGERDPQHDHGASALAVADAAGICGRGASCGVCETVSTRIPSRLITSSRAIRKTNTDTWRLSEAGAVAVAWVIALRDGAPQAVDAALRYLADHGAGGAVIEGTTALEWLEPKASVMVASSPGKRWKDVALRYVESCDIVLCNRVPHLIGDVRPPEQFFAAQPLSCDLASASDPGTSTYIGRLREIMGYSAEADFEDQRGTGGALTA